jgi:hypothetical protein
MSDRTQVNSDIIGSNRTPGSVVAAEVQTVARKVSATITHP